MKIKKDKLQEILKFIKKKKRSIVIVTIGILVCLYPTISNYVADRNHRETIQNYEMAVDVLDEETIAEEFEKAQEYNENLSGDPVHDPFVYGSGYALPDNYLDVLNIYGNGVMGYIEIPIIDCYLPIYHGTDEETLLEGVGHIEDSSLPIGGSSTHAVLTGHTGLTTSELFTNLIDLEVGDAFYIHVLNETLKYEIYEIEVIEPDDISSLVIEEGRDLVTLVTCTPYGVNTHRLLVKGERTEYNEETEEIVEETSSYKGLIIKILFILIILIILIIIIKIISQRKK